MPNVGNAELARGIPERSKFETLDPGAHSMGRRTAFSSRKSGHGFGHDCRYASVVIDPDGLMRKALIYKENISICPP